MVLDRWVVNGQPNKQQRVMCKQEKNGWLKKMAV